MIRVIDIETTGIDLAASEIIEIASVNFSRIRHHPAPWTKQSFGPIEWLDPAQIAQEMIDLLPRGPRPMTPKETAMLHKWFGP